MKRCALALLILLTPAISHAGDFESLAAMNSAWLPSGTRVLLGAGPWCPIERVRAGHKVVTHLLRRHSVIRVREKDYTGQVVTLTLCGTDACVRATLGSKVWVLGGRDSSLEVGRWVPIEELTPADYVSMSARREAWPVSEVLRAEFSGKVYCLEVEGDGSFVAESYAIQGSSTMVIR